MRWKIGMAVALVAAVGSFAVLATATDDDPPDGGPVAGTTPEATAARDPYVNFRVNPMYDCSATPEMIAESQRLRAELDARRATTSDRMAHRPPSFEERLAESRAAVAAERERYRARMAAGFPEVHDDIVPPTSATCSRLCDVLLRCAGETGGTARHDCTNSCRQGLLGTQWRADRVVELNSCEHL
ncbi:MAG: hypothetical protein HY905_15665 [Deltaproteobacteria bacterium]|nr:hypothetical protein [Deltaproteobacteria bacterium]